MKVEITRATVAGKKAREVGAVVDLPGAEARYLVAIGKAILAPDPVKAPVNKAVKKAQKAKK